MANTYLSKQNKEQAFEALFEEYYAPFCIYAKRFVEDKNVREDIVSEVFTSLWERSDEFDIDSASAIGYIKMCVKNRCLNYLKHLDYEHDFEAHIQSLSPIYETEIDSIYTQDEMYKMLYDALDKLPSNYKKIFIDSYFKGKTHEEIAHEMDISVKSTNRYKQKALELLREELKEMFFIIILLHLN